MSNKDDDMDACSHVNIIEDLMPVMMDGTSIEIVYGNSKSIISIRLDKLTGSPYIEIKLMKFVKDQWEKMKSTYLHRVEALAVVDALNHFDVFEKGSLHKDERYLVHEFKLDKGRVLEVKALKSLCPERGAYSLELTFVDMLDHQVSGNVHSIRRKIHKMILYVDEARALYGIIKQLFMGGY